MFGFGLWLKKERRRRRRSSPPLSFGYGFAVDKEWMHVNDPSAGSPTETLLRLLLPLNGKVWVTSLEIVTSEPVSKS